VRIAATQARWASLVLICIAFCMPLTSCVPSGPTPTVVTAPTAAPTKIEIPTLPEPTATLEEISEPTLSPSPTPEIVHLITPGEPGGADGWATDRSSLAYAEERRSIAEDFRRNLFERPFTAEVMDYDPSIDIVQVSLDLSNPWVYVTLALEGPPPEGSSAYYGAEFDLDFNGRGDFLIMGHVPQGFEWTTSSVLIYQDQNGDVGGSRPLAAEDPSPDVDGYETLIFDQGIGSDPDAGWIRRDPADPNRVQLAIKAETLQSDRNFAFGGFADDGLKDPGANDYNDAYNLAQAGSPYFGSIDYPIKALFLLDNTCRWSIGDAPAGGFAGQCSALTPEGCQPPPGGCPQGSEWWPDWCICGAN
jgi:hypothetical protein